MHRRTLVLLVVICLGHVLLISAQVQSRSGLPVIEAVAFGAFARVQAVTAGVADGVSGLWTNYFALRGAARENEQLRSASSTSRASCRQQQRRGRARRARSRRRSACSRASPAPTLAARVIAGNPSPGVADRHDRSRQPRTASQPNMAVIGARGVVGRVIGPVAPHAARRAVARRAATPRPASCSRRAAPAAWPWAARPTACCAPSYVPALGDDRRSASA